MPISFKCAKCLKPFKVSRELAGKKIRCKGCSHVFRIPHIATGSSAAAQPMPTPTQTPIAAQPIPATPVTHSVPMKPVAKAAQAAQVVEAVQAVEPVTPVEAVVPVTKVAAATPVTAQPIDTQPQSAADDFIKIQDEWIVECDDCGRQHKPDEKLMGKRVRCKCGSILHLLENPNNNIALAPLEPEAVDLSEMQAYETQPFGTLPDETESFETHAGPSPVLQAPPPSFKQKPETLRQKRKRDAEQMVRSAGQPQRRAPSQEEEEWGPIGKIVGGSLMIAGGALWTFFAWQAGYVYPYSLFLMGLGVVTLILGLVESLG